MLKSLVCAIVFAVATLPLAAEVWPDPETGIEWTYTLKTPGPYVEIGDANNAAISTSTEGELSIPASIGGYPVKSIAQYAFSGCSKLTGITIPDGVIGIWNSAFSLCSGITSIVIPDSVLSIDESVFYKCTGLTNVVIGAGIEEIGAYAFTSCKALESVSLPKSYGGELEGVFPEGVEIVVYGADVAAEASSYDGIYDGEGHGIAVTVTEPESGALVKYALDEAGPYFEGEILFTNVTDTTVWYAVEAENYAGVTNSATVRIAKADNAWLVEPSISGWTSGQAASAPDMGSAKFGQPTVSYGETGDQPPAEAGDYEATFAVAETENYAGLSKVVPFSISAAEEQEAQPSWLPIPGEGTVTVPKTWKVGQKVTWKAAAKKGSVFARWEGDFVDDLGLSRNQLRNPSLQFVVPEGFDTNAISAVFISIDSDTLRSLSLSAAEPLALNADVASLELVDDSQSYVTASASGLPSGVKFDAKTLSFSGKPKKPGAFTVKVTAKNASGYQWAENLVMLVANADGTVVDAPKPADPRRTAYHPLTTISMDPDMGTVTGTGVYAEGKKVSISAKAAKNCVFAGWYRDAELEKQMEFSSGDWKSASQSVVVPEVRYLFARFVTADYDRRNVTFSVDGAEMSADAAERPAWTNYCGVALDWPLAADAPSATTVKASGLPSGVKLVQDKVTKAYSLSGAPTAASKTDKKTGGTVPSKVKLTVTTAGKASVPYEADWVILPLPAWAVGDFNGLVGNGELGTGNGELGTVALTVAANGKVSGKLLEGGRSWTLGAASFDAVRRVGDNAPCQGGALDGAIAFFATVVGKNGKQAFTNEVAMSATEVELPGGSGLRGVANGHSLPSSLFPLPSSLSWTAWQNLWKTEPWKTDAKPFAKAPALALYVVKGEAAGMAVVDELPEGVSPYGTLTLKFAATGVATASAKFVTGKNEKTGKDIVYSASCSSVLVPAADDAKLFDLILYFPFKSGKFDGYTARVTLIWNGAAFGID